MNSSKIYYIKFSKTPDIDLSDNKHPFFVELSESLTQKDSRFMGFTDNDDMFIELEGPKLDKYLTFYTKWGFEFVVEDYTDKIISGEAQKEFPEITFVSGDFITDFRYDMTTKDDVLDKILDKGIDSLDDIDKEILNS